MTETIFYQQQDAVMNQLYVVRFALEKGEDGWVDGWMDGWMMTKPTGARANTHAARRQT